MPCTNSNNSAPRLHARLSTYAALAGAAVAAPALAPTASATVIYTPANITVTNSIDGIYLNVVTGVFGASGAATPGWDINPYNNGVGITFYGAASPSGVLATGTAGTTAIALRLTGGESISSTPDAGNFYNQFQTVGSQFQAAPGLAYLGFRFLNETTGATNYGWLQVSIGTGTSPNAGFPVTITGYAYENTGAAITAGQIPEPSTVALLGAMAAGAVGVRSWKRRRAA